MKDPKIAKYFSQKTHPIAMVFAVVLIIAGFCVWLFLYWPGLCMPLIFAGAVILLLLNLQIKDSEVDALCSQSEAAFREAFEDRFLRGDPRHREHVVQTVAPVYSTTYLAEGVLSRRGNDGKIRTSSCQCVGLLIGGEDVKLGLQTFSLIGGDAYTPVFLTCAFSELSDAVLSESSSPHTVWLEIRDLGGETVFRAQVSHDANSELAVQNILARIRKASLH